MPETRVLYSPEAHDALARSRGNGRYDDAFGNYPQLVLDLARLFEHPRMLEVGGGRAPLFDQQTMDELGCEYTINDIDPGELARAPEGIRRMAGDIAAPDPVTPEQEKRYDLVFSQMVFEHVADPAQAYRNIARMLAPGGIAISFIPTYYAVPFVLNRLAPEQVTSRLLRLAQPNRHDEGQPKFPAYYRWCTSTEATLEKLRGSGFRSVQAVTFYGHGYYSKVGPVHAVQNRIARAAQNASLQPMSTYAYLICEGA